MRGLGPAIILIIVLLIGGTGIAVHGWAPAASAASSEEIIPDESIRIRIIAQSDSEEDQAVKRAVRDRVSDEIESWGEMPSTIEEARSFIRSRLEDVQQAADRALEERGADYGAKVELAKVPFPEKSFKGSDYPAGEYEALRITLGQGAGANWWCVLFPPLCLTAATAKDDASAAEAGKPGASSKASAGAKAEAGSKTAAAAKAADSVKGEQAGAGDEGSDSQGASEKPKTEFFLWIMLKKLFAWIGSLFS
ncbi:stage II sporulation protein R [Cohnella xylanilytica]|uniref:Stage II sporulation protein R n=1 Tax=Cohnella xylanilytica TaxID=557555 RepID=A0A841UAL7_9BACL|nr:stage II sporulation protein R [Cohnella xylanilytica]MBB6696018.1 stage II sporulation protein R [Cohnella xylanilytica]